jgi:hypothetical protein
VPLESLPVEGPAQDSEAIRFLGASLLAQNRDVFTGVLFTNRPCTPTPSVDIVARTSLPVYDYFLKLYEYFLKLCDYFLKLCDYFLDEYDCFINKYNYSVLRSTTS